MALVDFKLLPGIDKQQTQVGAERRWVSCDNVRFRYGLPEKVGGWSNVTSPEATSTDKYPLEACSNISRLVLVTVPHNPAFSPVATFSNCKLVVYVDAIILL